MKAISALRAALLKVLPERAGARLQALDHYWRGEPEIKLLHAVVPPGRAAVDAGANIGTYTYFLRGLATRVYAYEPHPDLAARLRRLYRDVAVREVALSDHRGRATLRVPAGNRRPRHELASIVQTFDSSALSYSVEITTLDAEELTDIGFLKIDVEQHERQVLRGAQLTIERCRPIIMTEVTPLLYEDRLDHEFAFLADLNYRGWFSFDGRFLPLTDFEPTVHANQAHWNGRGPFMGTNMFFVPAESRLAETGPSR